MLSPHKWKSTSICFKQKENCNGWFDNEEKELVEGWLQISGLINVEEVSEFGVVVQVKGLVCKWDSIVIDFDALIKVSMRSMIS